MGRWFIRIFIIAGFAAGAGLVGKFAPVLLEKIDAPAVLKQIKGISANWEVPTAKAGTLEAALSSPENTPEGKNSWRDELLQSFMRTYDLTSKSLVDKSDQYKTVYLPRGYPLEIYGAHLAELRNRMGLKHWQGRRLKSSVPQYLITLEHKGDTLQLVLRHGRNYLPASSRLAILWTGVDSLSQRELQALFKLPVTHNFLIDPFKVSPILLRFLKNRPDVELFLQTPMEPFNYPYVNPGKETLFIHHSQKEVEKILDKKFSAVPRARGVATQYASRAIENPELLRKVIAYLGERDLIFIDLAHSQRSVSRKICREQKAVCHRGKKIRTVPAMAYLEQRIRTAMRYGDELLVLPYSPVARQQIARAYGDQSHHRWGVEITKLSELSHDLEELEPHSPEIHHAKVKR